MRLRVGTSGFSYKEWKGEFYPADLPASAMLGYYAERFTAVEINGTFYRMPVESTIRQWVEQVPDGFVFTLKAPQLITHRKRLKDVEEPVSRFVEVSSRLGDHLGPLLVQLPPNMKKDVPRLRSFLALIPAGVRVAMEFRHASWFDDEVFDALRTAASSLCIAHGEKLDAPLIATADWGYVRLRQVDYDDDALAEWARRVHGLPWSEAYVFFKHEDTGTGPRLARRFEELFAERAGR